MMPEIYPKGIDFWVNRAIIHLLPASTVRYGRTWQCCHSAELLWVAFFRQPI